MLWQHLIKNGLPKINTKFKALNVVNQYLIKANTIYIFLSIEPPSGRMTLI